MNVEEVDSQLHAPGKAVLLPGCRPVNVRYGTADTSAWMSIRSSDRPDE